MSYINYKINGKKEFLYKNDEKNKAIKLET